MIFLKQHSVASIFENNWPKMQTKDWRIQKNAVLNRSSRVISELNYSRSFPESVPLELQMGSCK